MQWKRYQVRVKSNDPSKKFNPIYAKDYKTDIVNYDGKRIDSAIEYAKGIIGAYVVEVTEKVIFEN